MAWYDTLLGRFSDYAQSKLRQLESLFAKGLGPQQANHIVKETSSIDPENRRGVAPWESLDAWRAFRGAQSDTTRALPTRRSDWLRASSATQTTFRSPFDYRYLIDFSYQVKNQVTGQLETVTNTLGFRRLQRWGKILDTIEDRIASLSNLEDEEAEEYGLQGRNYVPGTVTIRGFFRTQNA